ncbi:hypothetical protein RJT34_32666 [Clitoria ternatea]|uniref:SUPPRESSOR-OF-WHITE-APRICOT-like C-terminal domain-containing protein n=1 Tax=Clitoria ternatea TaxID=43366 RepID=A0AAN9F0Q1_CLITE
MLEFWASKEVFDPETISSLKGEMIGGPQTNSFPGASKDLSSVSVESGAAQSMPAPLAAQQQFLPNSAPPPAFPGSIVQPANQPPGTHLLPPPSSSTSDQLPPYRLFPPGLIPGMVRKMQIEIGEVNPSEGPMNSDSRDEDDEYDREYEGASSTKGRCLHTSTRNLQVDPETGTYADGSVERKPGSGGSGRLGLGATANPNEVSQYDDVYTSLQDKVIKSFHEVL